MLTYAREASAATQAVKSVQLDLHTTTLRKNLSTLHPTRNIKSLIDLCCVFVQSLSVAPFQLPSHLNASSQIESIAPSFHSSTKALSAFQLLLIQIYTHICMHIDILTELELHHLILYFGPPSNLSHAIPHLKSATSSSLIIKYSYMPKYINAIH